ncbi:BRCT domain-containing protein [Thiofilum flexile]|uniref:BRCT domain-containing protein n=1 Tax=Thiofilum flexile TaxID=125627 RepID=UPI000374695F|nr:BRCT domain-containing protein [Thiofilum flexile]
MLLTLTDIQRAWELKDPAFIDYLVALAEQPNPTISPPLPDEVETFEKFIQLIWSKSFRAQSYLEQQAYRVDHINRLEAATPPYVLPERLKLHQILMVLWRDPSAYARVCLIEVIRRIPFVYGPWKALKAIYKAAEAKKDYEIVAEIAIRLDAQRVNTNNASPLMMSHATRTYMVLRAWRYLRKIGQQLPVLYPTVAIQYLAAYTDSTNWATTWIFNHIAFHNKKHSYGRDYFGYIGQKESLIQYRAFNELWKRNPEPLLRLILLARAERVRQFAAEGLKADFATQLRDIEPTTIIQLGSKATQSLALDELIIFLLQNASKLEQQQFKALGLREVVIRLLESSSTSAQNYAAQYVKAYARDLSVEYLLKLAKNNQLAKAVRELALQLLLERDPRREVGLEAWGELLESEPYYKMVSEILRKYFGRNELTPDWFKARILSHSPQGFNFAKSYLFELHPLKSLGNAFFEELLNALDDDYVQQEIAQFALLNLKKLDLSTLSPPFIQTYLLQPLTSDTVQNWIQNDDIKANTLPIDFYQALVSEPDWNTHPFIQALKAQNKNWTQALAFNSELATTVMGWLSDVRRFKPSILGFEWLMKLVSSESAEQHQFAVERLSKAFTPADFAPNTSTASAQPVSTSAATSVDLQGQTFLFTGKMQSMTREAAEDMVVKANGKNSGSVTAKLDYLVIGDEGSPLYGNGRKGSKQVKAESLIAAGAALKIISETAFLKLLAGQADNVSADAAMAGSEYLWNLALGEAETPLRQFALEYLRRHHPPLALKATDRPVDPGAEIPAAFLTLDRVLPLLQHPHAVVRQLGLDMAEWELARWQPTEQQLLSMSESRYTEVRELLKKALLEDPTPANKTYHLSTAILPESFVYGLCESRHAPSRELGLAILQRERRLQSPQALYQLTESPDREVRNQVIRILWRLYRTPLTTPNWRPAPEVAHLLSKGKPVKTPPPPHPVSEPVLPQRPHNLPADYAGLQLLLRRWLYELPPGRLGREQKGMKPLAASVAKKALIETLRDLAVEDGAFAEVVLPLFQQFTQSRGKMERDACLVAATRIEHAHPTLAGALV